MNHSEERKIVGNAVESLGKELMREREIASIAQFLNTHEEKSAQLTAMALFAIVDGIADKLQEWEGMRYVRIVRLLEAIRASVESKPFSGIFDAVNQQRRIAQALDELLARLGRTIDYCNLLGDVERVNDRMRQHAVNVLNTANLKNGENHVRRRSKVEPAR